MRKWILLLITCFALLANGQTTLLPGDIVVLNMNADGNDSFSFMSLVDLESGTQIHFTDIGWDSNTGAFRTSCDGGGTFAAGVYDMCTYVVPGGGLLAGSVVTQDKAGINPNFVAYSPHANPYITAFSITYGDQCLVFQGTKESPVFLWAVSYKKRVGDGETYDWTSNGGGTDANSDLPPGLTDGVNALVIAHQMDPDFDNVWYTGPVTAASAEDWQARVVNTTNWSGHDSNIISHQGQTYTVTASSSEPVVSTTSASSVRSCIAVLGGNVTDDGGSAVTERGVIYSVTSTNNTPEIDGTGVAKVISGSGTGVFSETNEVFSPNTNYSFRAYAINGQGTSYGGIETFTTIDASIETFETESAGATSFSDGASFTLTGKFTVINIASYGANESGYYIDSEYNQSCSEQLLGSVKIESGKLMNLYSVAIWASTNKGGSPSETPIVFKGLKNGIVVQEQMISVTPSAISGGIGGWATGLFASAWNSADIDELEFYSTGLTDYVALDDFEWHIKDNPFTVPTLLTSPASSVVATSASLGGEVTSDGGAAVTERGIVYSISETTPEIDESGVIQNTNGDGSGVFSESIGSLSPVTTYYFQAYAINSEGTSYGGVQTFTTSKQSQVISFDALAEKTFGDADFAPGASASSSLPVTYTSSNENVATIVSNQVHIVGAGSCTIHADQSGDANYTLANRVSQSLTVNKAGQTITFNALADKTYGAADFGPGGSSSSGLGVVYSSSNTAVATIVNGEIHVVGAGGCTIHADQSGDANYTSANRVSQSLTVNKADQTITFNALADKTFGAADFGPGGSSSSGLGVVYSSSNTAVATIVNGEIHVVGAGSCTIHADQSGDVNYTSANRVSQSLTVNKAEQTITFNALVDKTYGDADFAPGGSSSSGLGVVYSSSNTAVATIVNGEIHVVGAGGCTIHADQSGDANYTSANRVSQSLTVNKAEQAITFNALVDKTYGDADFAPGGSSSSGLVVVYSSSNTAVATIVNGEIHVVGAGSCTIHADQSGDVNYTSANRVSQSLTVNKAEQTITFNALVDKTYGDADFAPGGSSSSGLGVVYSSSNTAVATIVNGEIHVVGAGGCTIHADQSGDANYTSANRVSQSLTVNKAEQAITFNALVDKTYGDADFAPGGSSSSGLGVVYSSSNTAVATIVNGEIHIVGAGSCTIHADQSGDANFNAANRVSQLLTVQVSTSNEFGSEVVLKIYPNPTSGLLYIEGGASGGAFNVYSNTGILVLSGHLDKKSLNVTSLKSGVYYLITDQERYKFVKK